MLDFFYLLFSKLEQLCAYNPVLLNARETFCTCFRWRAWAGQVTTSTHLCGHGRLAGESVVFLFATLPLTNSTSLESDERLCIVLLFAARFLCVLQWPWAPLAPVGKCSRPCTIDMKMLKSISFVRSFCYNFEYQVWFQLCNSGLDEVKSMRIAGLQWFSPMHTAVFQ